MSKIYLASPFFNEVEKNNVLLVSEELRNLGHDVYVPMEHSIENGWDLPNNVWAKKVFDEDVEAINNCDEVYAIVYGMQDDAGTSWEIGYSYGTGKKVTLIPVNETVYSLMVMNSSREVRMFKSLEELVEKKLYIQS